MKLSHLFQRYLVLHSNSWNVSWPENLCDPKAPIPQPQKNCSFFSVHCPLRSLSKEVSFSVGLIRNPVAVHNSLLTPTSVQQMWTNRTGMEMKLQSYTGITEAQDDDLCWKEATALMVVIGWALPVFQEIWALCMYHLIWSLRTILWGGCHHLHFQVRKHRLSVFKQLAQDLRDKDQNLNANLPDPQDYS